MPFPGITPSSAPPVAPRPVTPPPSADSTAATVPVNAAAAPAESASAPPLPISSIEQKELAYFATLKRPLRATLAEVGLLESSARRKVLALELLYMGNVGNVGNECFIGTEPLTNFMRAHPDPESRGDVLLGRLPQAGDPLFGVGSMAYQTLLTNACFPDGPLTDDLRAHSAYFLTQATRPPAPAPAPPP